MEKLTYVRGLEFELDIPGFDFEGHRSAYEAFLNNTGIKYQYVTEFGFGVEFTGTESELVHTLLLDQEFWNNALPEEPNFELTPEEFRENIFDQN